MMNVNTIICNTNPNGVGQLLTAILPRKGESKLSVKPYVNGLKIRNKMKEVINVYFHF